MVLFKRKPVKLEPLPKSLDDNTEVWVIEETGEVFVDYEKYLNRYDFYQQKSFTCESTGHSNYTFFEAKESEVGSTSIMVNGGKEVTAVQTEASKEINSIFPDSLRSPVLRYVQFRTTARMDDLVNNVFDHFKEQFMVGDAVSVEGENSRRYGKITDMTDNSRLHSMFTGQSMDDSIRSYTYVITMDDNGESITKYKASELQRDRKVYSKLILKQFLRNAVKREPWIGAPWMVRDSLAKRFDIPTKIPDNKTRDAVLAQKKASNAHLTNGTGLSVQQPYSQHAPNGHEPHINGHRLPLQAPGQGPPTFVNFSANPPPYGHQQMLPPHFATVNGPPRPYLVNGPPMPYNSGPPPQLPYAYPPQMGGPPPPHLANIVHQMPPPGSGAPMNFPFQTSFPHHQGPRQSNVPQPQQTPPLARPFEPVKYPCEDLEIKLPRLATTRPTLKFFSDDVPDGVEEPGDDKKTGILMKSLGPLLCAWETLNVHDTIYSLDSFTFDDFVDAMRFTSDEVECELFVEVHCAVLKQIVNSSGKIQTPLPKMDESEESDEEDSSQESTPTPEPEPPVRTTRSSLRKSGAQQIIKQRTPTPEPPKEIHKAAEFVADFDWIEQCKTRNFREGGWQSIVVALLYRLSFDPVQKDACDEILAKLVPPEEEPSIENIAVNYINLDVNLRISALDIILRLTVATEAFRDQLIAAAQEMTRLRKEKIEHQRKRKELADELFKLDLDRKIHLPDNTPASPTDTKENDDLDVSMTSLTDDVKEVPDAEDNDSETAANRRTRVTNKNKRKAAADEARKAKAKKAKAEAEKTKKQKEWEKLLDAIEKKKDELRDCEANINELDDDLRETLVHRSKVLGKDRFLNKYYWFEHNGMPFGGVPTSSTADYGYANGRIWVQGPDEYELQPCLEEPALSQDMQRFGFTIPQRKEKEEGSTHLSNSTEWAYYDDPEDIDKLLLWLDERGVRERVLRKELQSYRDHIAEYMLKMRKHLSDPDKTKEEEEETTTRVSTRNKTYVDKDSAQDRCLLWTNSIMRDELGYNHSEEYEPPRKVKAKPVKATKAKGRR
ncbi:Nn.00g042130.m01.CDS01 [Neocucurbitaria sp. VM-36]